VILGAVNACERRGSGFREDRAQLGGLGALTCDPFESATLRAENIKPELTFVGLLDHDRKPCGEFPAGPASTGRPVVRRHAGCGSQELRPNQTPEVVGGQSRADVDDGQGKGARSSLQLL